MKTPKVQPGILKIKPYVGGVSKIAGMEEVVKLSSNENPFGPSPKAVEAFQKAGQELHRYPASDHGALRGAIGQKFNLDPKRILCGAGSDEIITFICQCFTGPRRQVIYTEHGFSMYKISALAAGATPVMVAERNRVVDVDLILEAVTDKTSIVFVTNPGNPTGTMVSDDELARLAKGLPSDVLLVLDGAYTEYTENFDGGIGLVEQFPNIIMTRTFSKMYGLGGLRIGWAYGSEHVIDVLNRVRGPFNLSNAQLWAAQAALSDDDHVARCYAENARMRIWLSDALHKVGVLSDPSYANYILARFGSASEASEVDEYLRSEGIIVREVSGYGLPNCLRITIGDEAACRRVAYLVGQYKGKEDITAMLLGNRE